MPSATLGLLELELIWPGKDDRSYVHDEGPRRICDAVRTVVLCPIIILRPYLIFGMNNASK